MPNKRAKDDVLAPGGALAVTNGPPAHPLAHTGAWSGADVGQADAAPVAVAQPEAHDPPRADTGQAGPPLAAAPAPTDTAPRTAPRKTLIAAQLLEAVAHNFNPDPSAWPIETVGTDVATAVTDAYWNVAANGESILRLTIYPEQLEALRVGQTGLSLDPAGVERIALAAGARARTRIDAMARWCAQLNRALPGIDAAPAPAPTPSEPEQSSDLERTLATVVDEIARGIAPIITARGDDASVRGRLRALDLAPGPADRPAFFDYGMLIGTVDGVYEELVDREILAAVSLLQPGNEQGGIPSGATAKGVLETFEDGLSYIGGVVENVIVAGSNLLSGGGGKHSQPTNDPLRPPTTPPPPPSHDEELDEYEHLVHELEDRLQEPYSFQAFRADGDNRAFDFGLFVTYRQNWIPEGHQAGALVKTTTLAPREERSYTTRTTYKSSTTAVRATNIENQRRTESQDTNKAASDIVTAAKSSMGFEATTQGTVEVGSLISAESSAKYTRNSERSSQETRQAMRESVRKSAQEVKESIRTEVTTSESRETFQEETGKISNPNDELPVTYLFYELQRRFRVSERIHEMVPVVMVARKVPPFDRITRGWLFTNAWIVQRALLDKQLEAALQYLLTEAAGLEARLVELRTARDEQRTIVQKLEGEVLTIAGQLELAYQALQWLRPAGQNPGVIILGEGRESLQKAYDLAVQRDQIVRQRLAEAAAARDAANHAYTEALGTYRDREMTVRRLRIHVKQNILHYMRAIWNMEDRDQRFFELQRLKVPRLAGHLEYRLVPDPPDDPTPPVPPLWIPPYNIAATLVTEAVDQRDPTVLLGDIADLEHPLGYKGNLMVFPLRQHNVLTKFLALPYLDNRMGAQDPELLGNFTLSELETYAACARAALAPERFAALLPQITQLYDALMDRPFPDEEEIVVPTNSTFIEALPGTRPVLEDFKLLHRAINVSKAAAEVRARELENLRLVARIRDGQLSDPDIQTMVVTPEGAGITVPTAAGGQSGGES